MKASSWLALGLASAALLLVTAATLWRRPAPPVDGPAPVPPGSSVELRLPDVEGRPVVWKVSRQRVDRREALRRDPEVVPDPAPRETPIGPHTDSARALAERAREAWRSGELREAIQLFDAAVEADPEDGQARSDYGRLLTMMHALDLAYPHLERAAELAPDDPRVWLDLLSYYSKSVLIERSWEARSRAEALSDGRRIVQDPYTGIFLFEDDSPLP